MMLCPDLDKISEHWKVENLYMNKENRKYFSINAELCEGDECYKEW